jgi:hypothetical protein
VNAVSRRNDALQGSGPFPQERQFRFTLLQSA